VSRTLDRGSTLYPRAIPARRRAPREEPHIAVFLFFLVNFFFQDLLEDDFGGYIA
jgi:hypothetical protein